MPIEPHLLDDLLVALHEHLAAAQADQVHLLVCGGAAMNAQGFVRRVTRDVDVVGLLEDDVKSARPLPPAVLAARAAVAADYGLDESWLNDGPTSLLDFGLPQGFEARLLAREYGPHLRVSYLGRFDLVCLKLYAWADSGEPRHESDLRALTPTGEELGQAARLVVGHDPQRAGRLSALAPACVEAPGSA